MNAERLAEIRAKHESAVSAARSPGGVEELRDFIENCVPELLAAATPLDDDHPFFAGLPQIAENTPEFPVYGSAEPEEGETWPV